MNVDFVIAFEDGTAEFRDIVENFAEGIKTGMVYQLQGSYGRFAESLIEADLIDRDGNINEERYEEVLEDA